MNTKDSYQDNLEELLRFFDGKRVLTISDVTRYTRRNREWVRKRFGIEPRKGISIVNLARELS